MPLRTLILLILRLDFYARNLFWTGMDADITDKIVYGNEKYCGNRFLMKEILDSTSPDGRLIRSYFDFVQSKISDSEYLHSVPYE